MKTRILTLGFLLSPLSFLLSPCLAQVPRGFNYQALALDGGNPVRNYTTLQVKITLMSDTLAPVVLWEELHSPVRTNNYGVFNLIIGTGIRQSGSAQLFSEIDWTKTPLYLRTDIYYPNAWKYLGTSSLWSVPYSMIAAGLEGAVNSLEVVGDDVTSDEALFEVKRKDGETMFAVYNHGVRVYMPLDTLSKARKGGFAIGGFSKTKGTVQDYFVVNPDSIRAYIDTNPGKARKGGFAIGGFDQTKAGNEEYLRVTRDSTRIYINDTGTKARKGGFAIGGFDQTKGVNAEFLNVATDASGIVKPSQNRILWYPLKNAFLTGRVLIERPDSVGVNSFASGYESKAKGAYSQALGYKAIARGDYSTAIGKNAVAQKINSFAFGENAIAANTQTYALGYNTSASGLGSFAMGYNAKTVGQDAFAIGSGTEATGTGSYAIGFIGRDSAGYATGNTKATGDWSVAIGMGAQAKMKGALSIGTKTFAENEFSLAIGYNTQAKWTYATAIGASNTASGNGSVAMGYLCQATEHYSYAIGYNNKATANSSTAIGTSNLASGVYSTAMGQGTVASGNNSTAMGEYTTASGSRSTAMGTRSVASQGNSTAIGWYALASGYGATAMGVHTTAQALYSTVVGSYNVVSGTVNGWVPWEPIFAVGNGQSDATRSNAMTVLKDGQVGIGTTTPQYNLEIASEALGTTSTVTVPWQRLYGNSANQDQLRIFHRRFGNGSDWTTAEIRIQKTVDVTDMAYMSFKADYLEFGMGTAPAITVTSSRYVGIGTTNPGTFRLYVSGAAYASGGWASPSDIRLKKNITPITGILGKILSLGGIYYEWRKDEYPDIDFESGRQVGLPGQDLEKVFPELVKTDDRGFKSVAYDKLSVYLLEGMKEQQQQILDQQKEIDELKALVGSLIASQGK